MNDGSRPIRGLADLDSLQYDADSALVTVIAQHARTGEVLMIAYADRDALEQTLKTGEMWYRSRSRGLWHKGATSGNTQRVEQLFADCDGDAVLALVTPLGPACHRNTTTCFGDARLAATRTLEALDAVIAERAKGGDDASYTRRLLGDRNLRLKKIGEEAAELVLACADDHRERAVSEAADLVYHALTAVRATGGSWRDVERELEARLAPPPPATPRRPSP